MCGLTCKVLVIDTSEAGKEAFGLRRCFLYVYVYVCSILLTPPWALQRLGYCRCCCRSHCCAAVQRGYLRPSVNVSLLPIHCNAAVSAGSTLTFVFTITASAAAFSLHLVRRRAATLYLLPGLVYNGLAALLFTSFSNSVAGFLPVRWSCYSGCHCCVVFIPADLLFVIVGAPLRLYAVLPGVFSTLRCWRYATVLY